MKVIDIEAGSLLSQSKVCTSCGFVHESLPLGGKLDKLGLWFNCQCNSTLFIASDYTRKMIRTR